MPDPDLSKFEPNSGRPLPAATVKEMNRLARERAGKPKPKAKKKAKR